MATAEAAKVFTPEDLLVMPYGDKFELVDGHLVETGMSLYAALVAGNLIGLLKAFNKAAQAGFIFTSDASYQCFPNHPHQIRKPDVSFIAAGRLSELPQGHCRIAPDLAVEVTSPNDVLREVTAKVEEYLTAGVQLVWVVETESRRVFVYRRGEIGSILSAEDHLSGEGVLAGFDCAVEAIFRIAS